MVPGAAGPIGQVAIEFSLAAENARVTRQRGRILFFSIAVALGAALLLSVAVEYQMGTRLRRLAAAVRTLRRERILASVPVATRDEIGELSEAFNEMGRAVLERADYLQRELALAARIQTSILPRRLDVPGLELHGVMEPAAEAGGDYYEVLPTHDGAWLGIADVSGHGLNAGLTMMMLQSVVSGLIQQDEHVEVGPAELLTAVNRVLYENVRERLGTNDHVTCTLLRYRRDGTLTWAGAHLPLLVYRAATKGFEHHEVMGSWLGVVPDVRDLNPERTLKLEVGDVLVLYTDGIIEARDVAGELFELERFRHALLEVIDQPLSVLSAHALGAARRWCATTEDDMTLLLARRVAEDEAP